MSNKRVPPSVGMKQEVDELLNRGEGLKRGRELIARFRYPAAMECLEKDLEACLVHLKFPLEHRLRIRSTNALERIIEEIRRRTNSWLRSIGSCKRRSTVDKNER